MGTVKRWQNQEEAVQFALSRPAVMMDMDMGTGKTRVTIDTVYGRKDVYRVLVICPKAVLDDHVWRTNLEKFAEDDYWQCLEMSKGSVKQKAEKLKEWVRTPASKQFIVINYDSVWRKELGDFFLKEADIFQMIVLDESHRAKSPGSKVSKYLARLGKRIKYRMCLSGTPMANSPLDVYGQYRFLDPSIFGTNYRNFLEEYALLGGPDRRFIVGFKNQKTLNEKFKTIAYTCKMSDVADKIKLPDQLPPLVRNVNLPTKSKKLLKDLEKEFVAECENKFVVVNNALVKMLRMQQITSGFCVVQEGPMEELEIEELNTSKADALLDIFSDMSPTTSLVVFCRFRHDIDIIKQTARKAQRKAFEVSGSNNTLEEWKKCEGGVLVVQIQAGAEGIDLTKANHAIYFSLPHSLAQYNQSRARLYRPGQKNPVSFSYLIAKGTVDEAIYKSLQRKEDIIESIKAGTFDIGGK